MDKNFYKKKDIDIQNNYASIASLNQFKDQVD